MTFTGCSLYFTRAVVHLQFSTGPSKLFKFPKIVKPAPSLGGDGHLQYSNTVDRSLNKAAADKIRKYRADYNQNPPNAIFFTPVDFSKNAARRSPPS